MRTIDSHPVRFGELAGPLAHGPVLFDWQIRALEAFAEAVDYPFRDLIETGHIPYAPVVARATVHRYPTLGDAVSVDVVPRDVGKTSLDLRYDVTDGDGDPVATARTVHVTIGPEGGATPIPETTREQFAEAAVEEAPAGDGPGVGPADDAGDGYPTFDETFTVRSPHVEGVSLAYFEEYPRFAAVALESFLDDNGASLATLRGERQPFRLAGWEWEFSDPVPLETRLRVATDVRHVSEDAVRVEHTFTDEGDVCIAGVTEYGCFDRAGERTAFPVAALAPFRDA